MQKLDQNNALLIDLIGQIKQLVRNSNNSLEMSRVSHQIILKNQEKIEKEDLDTASIKETLTNLTKLAGEDLAMKKTAMDEYNHGSK